MFYYLMSLSAMTVAQDVEAGGWSEVLGVTSEKWDLFMDFEHDIEKFLTNGGISLAPEEGNNQEFVPVLYQE